MTSDNEMRGEWGDKRVQTRRWKICTYEMATYVAFWRAIRVPAVNNRYCRTHTPFHCLSGRACADDRKQFVQPTSPAPMVFCWALISKEVHTQSLLRFLLIMPLPLYAPAPPRYRQGLTGHAMCCPNNTFPWCCAACEHFLFLDCCV